MDKASQIRKRTEDSQRMAKGGKVKQARVQLDKAYEDAKLELERLREGETLVRRLEFANKEEEYHYELDRNDTHQMLLKVLLEDQQKGPNTRKQIDGFVAEAKVLRKTAEGEANNGAFDKAVKSLERSTKNLQRAIRSAGVYIPG